MILFPNLLRDPCEYAEAEKSWQDLWIDAEPSSDWVTPWLNTAFVNGQPCRDGNPIFSAHCPSRGRALRVVQAGDEDGAPRMTAWISQSEDVHGEPQSELVVWCVLSEVTRAAAKALIARWIHHTEPTAAFSIDSVDG